MSLVEFTVTRNTQKNVINSEGFLENVGNNVPGFEYKRELIVVFDDPESDSDEIEEVFTYRGVLIEPASTNILTHSNNLSSGWVRNGSDYTSILQVSNPKIISTEDAWKVVPKNGQLTRYLANTNTNISNDTGTASNGERKIGYAFIKLDPGMVGYVGWKVENDSSAGRWFGMVFDEFQTNYLVQRAANVSGIFRGIIPYPNGWFLCYIGGIANNSSNALKHFCFGFTKDTISNVMSEYVPNSGLSYYPIGDGVSAGYFGGAQVEESDIMTSYIKTESSAVTRNADIIRLLNADQYTPNEGQVVLEWEQYESDTLHIGLVSGSVEPGVRKLKFIYTSTEQKLYIDDVLVDSITGNYDWSGMDKIELGNFNGTNQPTTHLRLFAINENTV